jgi:16S rRNA (cytosine1402-N4)-methyltransferase
VAHEPVLAAEVAELLGPALERGGVFVDATLGRAGHALRILESYPGITLVGLDRDPDALEASRSNLAAYQERVRLYRDEFSNLATALERLGDAQVRGVLFDLGVSSPQLDEARRGFSFRNQGPLDMRMDPEGTLSARDIVNEYEASELEGIIRTFGEERFARRVAKAIIAARPIEDTTTLAEVVRDAIPAATRRTGGHPARRTFQALRIAVNDELGQLASALPDAISSLATGGRIAVLSYHSLEDRIVKRTFTELSKGCICPPSFPICTCGAEATVRLVTRKPVRPSEEEQGRNPRASAARLRVAEKLGEVAA